MPIHSFLQLGACNPEAVAAMSEAFDAACKELGNTDNTEMAQEVIARWIIASGNAW
jgi:hypothetical protein